MASLLFCGLKLAACGLVLSIWGVIMLLNEIFSIAMLEIFFTTHSAALIEDVPFTEKDFKSSDFRGEALQNIYTLYNKVGYNCFIAAVLYVGIGFLSFCQVRLNKRKEYLVH
ncbi:ribonuclease kappa-A-like [Carassius carassius]|uniref:ribonuclease kappa-A-like n=1 Tax=Carassius carassius TaxID=217509 RepID=UPI002869318F|nr:ribonuclease kappa-A-like [Carassius carassius]